MANSLKTALRQALKAHDIKPDRIDGVMSHVDLLASTGSLTRNGEPDTEAIETYANRIAAMPGYTSPDGDGAAPTGRAAALAEARRRFGNQPGWPTTRA